MSRATGDLDFVLDAICQGELIGFLEGLGHETVYRSSGYSNHVHPISAMGRLDFIYVDGGTADILFSEAVTMLSLGEWKIPVPRPEHLIPPVPFVKWRTYNS